MSHKLPINDSDARHENTCNHAIFSIFMCLIRYTSQKMNASITCKEREREQEQMLLLLRSLLGYILRRETKGLTSSVMKKSIDRRSHHNIKGLIPAILTQVTVHRGQSGWHWPQKQVLTIQHTESCWAITPLEWSKLTNQFHQWDDFFFFGNRQIRQSTNPCISYTGGWTKAECTIKEILYLPNAFVQNPLSQVSLGTIQNI